MSKFHLSNDIISKKRQRVTAMLENDKDTYKCSGCQTEATGEMFYDPSAAKSRKCFVCGIEGADIVMTASAVRETRSIGIFRQTQAGLIKVEQKTVELIYKNGTYFVELDGREYQCYTTDGTCDILLEKDHEYNPKCPTCGKPMMGWWDMKDHRVNICENPTHPRYYPYDNKWEG